MALKSWATIKTELRTELWSFPTEARTQVAVHDKYFLEGIMDLQKWVPCLQINNTSQFPFCSTFFQCGKTLVASPPWGIPKRIYTIANDEWCDEVFYRSSTFKEVDCFVRANLEYTAPENDGMLALPMGIKFAEATSDNDCAAGRARSGLWNIYRGRLYVAPWIQSNETLIFEWDGFKGSWVDTDMLDDTVWTARVLAALRTFVEWKHCCRFGDDVTEKMRLKQQYAEDLAMLIHDCREATQQQHEKDCSACEQPVVTQAQLDDDAVPES
jgi:hypothetical protein